MMARSHPNQLQLQSQLNSLWHGTTSETSMEPLTYVDAFKIRVPGIPFLGLGPDEGGMLLDPNLETVIA